MSAPLSGWERLRHWFGWPAGHHRPHEMLIAALGGLLGILSIWFCSRLVLGPAFAPLIVPSFGASAVLVFAVPHSPLTQPWAVLGGHVVSALIGVACQTWLPGPALAGACAVGLALLAMHALRCIHPPGGATALTAVIGGPAVQALGFQYVLTPVALNCLLIILLGIAFNYLFPWRRYPLALMPASAPLPGGMPGFPPVTLAQVEAAIDEQRVVLDISPEELLQVIEATLRHAAEAAPAHTLMLRIGSCYGNNRPGIAWAVRRIVDERPSPTPEFDLVVYEIVAGQGRGRIDSCPRREFLDWAACEIRER